MKIEALVVTYIVLGLLWAGAAFLMDPGHFGWRMAFKQFALWPYFAYRTFAPEGWGGY